MLFEIRTSFINPKRKIEFDTRKTKNQIEKLNVKTMVVHIQYVD